jgi:glycosyltransferase involved in cell wall biosynthesis
MKLVVPLMPTDQGHSGIFTYLERLSELLPTTAPPGASVTFHVLRRDRCLFPALQGEHLAEVPDVFASSAANVAWHLTVLPVALRRAGADVLLLPAANRRVSPLAPARQVLVVHDLNPLEPRPGEERLRTFYSREVLHRCYARAQAVVAVSEFTARQLRRVGVDERLITVIPNGVDLLRFTGWSESRIHEVLRTYRLQPGFFLYVSRIEHPAKNHRRLLEAYARLRHRRKDVPPLIFAGHDHVRADVVHRRAEAPDLRSDVHFLGYVVEEHLPALYAKARALVYPSLAEGFGLPLLQAMAAVCPVLCSDRPPMNDVIGEAGLCFDPEDPDAIAAAMASVLDEPERMGSFVERGRDRVRDYTWTATAQALWRLVQPGTRLGA